jgi:RNA polymerase sigma-54 factor
MALSMGYGLVQEQRMKLTMTPELRQAIQILQYSATDLLHYIQEQLVENPVLEIDETAERGDTGKNEWNVQDLRAWAQYLKPRTGRVEREVRGNETNPIDRVASPEHTLTEVLETQLRYLALSPIERKVCTYLVGNLNENGYLDISSDFVCKRFNIDEDTMEACLRVIHSLDPAGVGARSLAECLRIQLERDEEPDPIALKIVQDHLRDLAEGRVKKIARALDCDTAVIQRAVDRIKRCNPRPGLAYHVGEPRYVVPDVVVERVENEYVVLVNDGYVPRLTVSKHYEQLLCREDDRSRQATHYLKNWFQSAMWLVKSIEQRRHTLARVSSVIVEKQRDFFDHGLDYLKPLTLKEIADELGIHESTVSRATQHKYMQTPRGCFPFRFFFPSGVSTDAGGNTSAESVKNKIEQLIAQEDKRQPLSDQKIADLLKAEGVRISRRTVAKYREEMGILSSTLRKRYEN